MLWAAAIAHGQIIITNFPGLTLNNVSALEPAAPRRTPWARPAPTSSWNSSMAGSPFTTRPASSSRWFQTSIFFGENAGISSGTLAAGLTDTRVIYDAGSSRWIATELTADATANNILLARSDTLIPPAPGSAVSFQASSTDFGDFDTLGVDSQGIYVAVNDFSGNTFDAVSFFSVPKADILAATPLTVQSDPSSIIWTPIPTALPCKA